MISVNAPVPLLRVHYCGLRSPRLGRSFVGMEVLFSEIPVEGLHLDGELPASIFELSATDPIRPMGPVHYSADIYAFEEVIALHGRLAGPFQLQCGACLEYFPYQADFPQWTSELDREPGEDRFDLARLVREDFLLNLPAHPRCDEFVEGRVCPRAHLFEEEDEDLPVEEEDSGSHVWDALDDLK